MIKVPGTEAGLPAVAQLLGEGVNVNITLLFARERHEQVMWTYIEALEQRAAAGLPIEHIASVASFFVSRVDTLVDSVLRKQIEAAGSDETRQGQLRVLLGKSAIANARLAYARFREIFGGERFAALRARGAQVQRPLWASTSAKDPAYRDVVYIEELIGPDTVNTLPQPTLKAFQDHGRVRRTLDTNIAEAEATLAALDAAGIDIAAVTRQLEREGVDLFVASYDALLDGVAQKQARVNDRR
jgi:transaldolase